MKRLILIALVACSDRGAPARHDGGSAIVKPATADAATTAPSFVGVITAADSVDIAPRFQGVVATIQVRVGDAVTEGQVVAEMDQKSMQEELRAAEAALGAAAAARRQADVDLEDARRKLQLETKAVAQGVSPSVNVDEAKLAVKRAQATVQKASSTVAAESSHVQTARDHVTDTALRAPSSGTVAMRFKDPGATVASGAPILRIVGQGALRLRFALPPDRAQVVIPGTTVHATIDTIAHPVAAVVRQVSPTIDPASGMIIVEAELASDPAVTSQLRPGLAATVR